MTRDLTEEQKAEMAVLSVLKDWPLEPGQMLFMGPISVAKLSKVGAYDGRLPDTMVIPKEEWNRQQEAPSRSRKNK